MSLHSSALTAERAISQEDSVPYLMDAKGLTTLKAPAEMPSPPSDQQPVIGIGTSWRCGTPLGAQSPFGRREPRGTRGRNPFRVAILDGGAL